MRRLSPLLLPLLLSACAPSTYALEDPKTGQVVHCSRGFWGVVSEMETCAQQYEASGFRRVDPDTEVRAGRPVAKPAQARPGQPASGQPSFGQPSFGQPNFGQPVFDPNFAPNALPPAAMPVPVQPAMPAAITPFDNPEAFEGDGAEPTKTYAPRAAKPAQDQPYFSQYPTSTPRKEGELVLPDFLK